MDSVTWRKSSRSHGGQCVEVGGAPAAVGIRDTKDPSGRTLMVSRATWSKFIDAVQAGNYQR